MYIKDNIFSKYLVQFVFNFYFRYIFESLGFLVASILMNSIQYMKKINENGIKKM